MNQPLDYYLSLKYPISIYPEEEGGYTALISDLQGCMTQGETLEQVVKNIEEARELWIETVYYRSARFLVYYILLVGTFFTKKHTQSLDE